MSCVLLRATVLYPAKLSDPIRVGIRIWTRRNSDTLCGITLAFLLTFPIAFAFYKSLHFRPVFRPEFRPAIGWKWCQFRLVQTRIQRRIPAQKTHQLLLDSAKGRKGCKIPSSSDSDSEVDSQKTHQLLTLSDQNLIIIRLRLIIHLYVWIGGPEKGLFFFVFTFYL